MSSVGSWDFSSASLSFVLSLLYSLFSEALSQKSHTKIVLKQNACQAEHCPPKAPKQTHPNSLKCKLSHSNEKICFQSLFPLSFAVKLCFYLTKEFWFEFLKPKPREYVHSLDNILIPKPSIILKFQYNLKLYWTQIQLCPAKLIGTFRNRA